MDFRAMQRAAHENSRAKGFYDDDELLVKGLRQGLNEGDFMAIRRRLILARLAMIASEVGEAVDAVRACDTNERSFLVSTEYGLLEGTTHGSELADIVIRTMDLAEYIGIDLGREIQAKMARNISRPHKHGKLA